MKTTGMTHDKVGLSSWQQHGQSLFFMGLFFIRVCRGVCREFVPHCISVVAVLVRVKKP